MFIKLQKFIHIFILRHIFLKFSVLKTEYVLNAMSKEV